MNIAKSCALSVALVATLAACASPSAEVTATYVSPEAYSGFTCTALGQEAQRVSARAAAAAGEQDRQAEADAVATGVALVLFWPAVFFLNGDDANAAELARLRGEMEAIEQANIQRGCGLRFG